MKLYMPYILSGLGCLIVWMTLDLIAHGVVQENSFDGFVVGVLYVVIHRQARQPND